MYQIAFGLLEDNTHAWWFHDLFRLIFSLLEILVAWLIPFTYEILVKIANNTIISGDVVRVIFGRVQLILGVIMIFKLSMAVIQYIINPDMMDDKSKGLSGIITRIIIMLVLLTSIVPLNIPKSSIVEGSYNDYLRDDGLLFGTLYFAQSRILNTNIIGTIILGDENSKNGSFDDPEFAGNQLALLVMKTVIRPNDYDGTTIGKCDDEDKCICPRSEIDTTEYGSEEEDQAQYDRYYNDPTLTANQLLDDMRNIKCFDDSLGPFNLDGEAKYAYTYLPIVGGILGGFVLITLISFCVDVAIRAIKLAILRLIAPIPIMSYIDPKSGQNGAFQNWVKTLTKTFLDLFIRLAIIFFVILVVRSIADDIAAGNFKTFDFSTPVGAFATIFIIIGLFFFAKQAPQFIYEALGMKYDKGAGIFSGLGKIAATGMALGGSIGSASTSLRASHEAGDGRALTIGKTALGGARGFLNGLGAATSAKDHPTQAVREAQAKRNARVAELAENGGSVLGAIGATAQQVFTGTSPGDRLEAEWKAEEEKIKYERQKNAERKKAMDRANSKGVESLATSGTIKAKAGTQLYKYNGLKANASSFRSAISAAKSGGSYTMYSDSSGRLLTENQYSVLPADERSGFAEGKYMDWEGMHINMKDADLLAHEFDDANIADYYEQALSGRLDDSVIIDANTRFAEANGGVGLETEFGGATGLKASFGSVGSDLDNRELALANEKNSKKAQAAKANANYYKANRK